MSARGGGGRADNMSDFQVFLLQQCIYVSTVSCILNSQLFQIPNILCSWGGDGKYLMKQKC